MSQLPYRLTIRGNLRNQIWPEMLPPTKLGKVVQLR